MNEEKTIQLVEPSIPYDAKTDLGKIKKRLKNGKKLIDLEKSPTINAQPINEPLIPTPNGQPLND